MLETFTLTTFCEGDIFKVRIEAEQVLEIQLVQARPGKYQMPAGMREPFSLIFKGSKEIWLPQGSYVMEHEIQGIFELFIVPVLPPLKEDEEWFYYEAFFG